MDKLASAKTVSQVDDVLEAASRQIEEMAKKEDAVKVEKIKELMQDAAKIKKMFVLEKDSQDLRDEIESLKNALPQQASLLEKKLDEVRESKDREELLDTTKRLGR